MMEVDMQSPPSTFRPMGYAMKRPRSPGSPSQERQAKRLTLAPLGEGLCVRRAADGVLENGRLANQDDWVRQARELTIGSPLAVVGSPYAVDGGATVGGSRADENMAIDYEEAQSLRAHVHLSASRQWTAPKSHLPSIHITTTPTPVVNELHAPSLSPAPFSVLTEPPSSSTESASSASSLPARDVRVGVTAPHPHPPDIFLFLATPSDTSSHQHHFISEYGQADEDTESRTHARMLDQTQTQTQTLMPDRIEGSPRPSRITDLPTSSGRKHRVTMGPRADCMKCRTGVKGHWMHFD